MAARNPLLDAINGGGGGNPLLDAIDAGTVPADAISAVTGKTPLKAAPSLADTITNPNDLPEIVARRASEAQRLSGEKGMGEVRPQAADTASVLRGLGITTAEAWRSAGAGVRMQAQDLLGPAIDGWIEKNMPGALTSEEQRKAFGGTNAEIDYRRSQLRSEEATPEFESDLARAIYGGVQSTLQTAPGIAAGFVGGPGLSLAILGAQTEAQAYGKYRERGATPMEAGLGAIGEGATEILTEMAPMGFLVGKLGKIGAGEFLAGMLARELPLEQVATAVQDAIDTAVANPNKTWADYRAERPSAAFDTMVATLVQTGIYGGAGAIGRRIGSQDAPADPSLNAAAIDALNPSRVAPQDTKADVPLTPEDRASSISDSVLQEGKNALADAMAEVGAAPARAPKPVAPAARAVAPAADTFSRMVQITLGSESRNRDHDSNGNVLTSPAGAKGKMQVMDGTNRDPGYGVRPAQDDSLSERARVGRDYLAALLREYKGDPSKMWGAYNWGPGNLNDAIAKHGSDWLSHAPDETRKYVFKNLSQLGQAGFDATSGEMATIAAPEQTQIETESPMDFAARVLGEDFLSPLLGSEAQEVAPAVPVTPAPASLAPEAVQPEQQASPTLAAPAPAATSDIRGEGIDNEWSRFSDTSGTLGIPRAEMPQIDAAHRGAFANFLKGRGITSHDIEIPAESLKPTQAEYSEGRIAGASEREGGNRAILTSNDGYIVDGHHQWMAARDKGESIRAIMLDAPIEDVLQAGHDFPSSTVDDGEIKQVQQRGKRDRRNDTEADLLTFIAANGGINDEGGHLLRGGRNLQRFIPGQGLLIRPGGQSLDYMRERLAEVGWLPEESTEADLLDLIEQASFSPVYHPSSSRGERDAVGADQQEARQADALALVKLEAERLGLEGLDDRSMERAATLSMDGYSEQDALWAVVEQAIIENAAAYPVALQEEYNVPFDAEGATGWEAVQDPFPESARGSDSQEGGERPAPDSGAAGASQDAARESGETESRARIEDTPSGKGVVVRGASEAELEAIKAALPEKASGMAGRDGGVTYSKKHEDVIRSALRTMPEADTNGPSTGLVDGQATPVASDARQESEPLPAAETPATPSDRISDDEFTRIWQSAPFKRVVKMLNDPNRESPVARGLAQGWSDGQAKDLDALDRYMESDRTISAIMHVMDTPSRGQNGFNPSDSYVEGFYAATFPEPRDIRTVKAGDTLGIAGAHDLIATALGRSPETIAPTTPPEGRTADAAQATAASAPTKPKKAGDNRHVMNGQRWRIEKAFDYLTAGQVYEVESARRDSAYFRNVESGGGTSIKTYQIGRALDDGSLKLERRADAAPQAVIGERGNRVSFPTPKDGVQSGKIARIRQTPEGRTVYDIDVDGGGLQNAFADEATILPEGATNPVTPAKSLSDGDSKAAWRGRGAQAFRDGGERLPPKHAVAGDSGAWMDGWDEAYRAAQAREQASPAKPARAPMPNAIVSDERAEKARAVIRAALSGTKFNSGIDPELLAAGTTLAVYHIERGARRFSAWAKAVSEDLGMSMATLKPYLRAWYTGAQMTLEDSGEDVSGMDGPGAVKAAITMIEDSDGAPSTQGAPAPQVEQGTATGAPGQIEQAFADAFLSGRAFASITEARAYAAQVTGERYEPGTAAAKTLDEAIESAIVIAARKIAVQNEGNPVAAYQRLVQLYGQQPRLGVRTSTSIEQQAYSTPVPLAYLASRLAGISQDTTVYEPSAGNGALLIDARATYVTANELNPDRIKQLRAFLPGAKITEEDAAYFTPPEKYNAVIANPPFGAVKDDANNTVRFQVDAQYSTNEIDHAIAMRALEAMQDDGSAVLIVGGINKTITDPKKRADAYNGKAKREFYFKLYSAYNVTDHFTVDGALYAKQGAGWPVDVIVIKGRGKSSRTLPAVSAPRQYASWDALQEVLTNGGNAQATGAVRSQDGIASIQGERANATNVRDTGSERAGRDNGRTGRDTAQQPVAVRGGLADGEPGGLRVDAGRARVDQAAEPDNGGTVAQRDPVTPEVEENARQVAYTPGSRSDGMGTLVPVNMQTAISDALASLEDRRGNIDAYVGDRLGYTANELVASFGAEQVDAIGLAIDNIERGAGFIIGDQTGVGKGRVNAAIIRYAIKTGRNAIFVTEKPNLYADMFRDMEDIGLPKMLGRPVNAVMTNSGETVPLGDGRSLKSGSEAKKHEAMLRDLSMKGLKASNVDVLLTTYSQMQTVQGKSTVRQEVIRRLANGGVVMFDESHNAGGQKNVFKEAGSAPNRAEFARELVANAQGVFYSSATYAKRPDVMDLYAATDMKLAVDDVEKLGEAIAKGGVPMQQVVAAMLARSGQYVRRERSFDGIAYNTPQIEVDREQYNNVATVLAAIQDFSEGYVKDAVALVDEQVRASGENVAADGSMGGAGAASTNFTAVMHNVVDQMLLAFAADSAAQRAIETIKRGEKPVITLASTLETFIDEYASEAGLKVGDKIDITFADIFHRYLERTRRYTVKKPFADKKDKPDRRRLTDQQLGAAGVAAFREAQQLISTAGLDSLPGSPLDYILGKIEAAGYTAGEITGRTMGIDYRPDGTYLKKRGQSDRSIKGRLATINGFNDGTINAIILNKSGSTGLSLHASEKFKDKSKRRMIIVQAEGNIDTHMQILGRVHRTGQVVLPEYDQLVVGVPAARRPAAVLAKKMASLNANTTASRDSALTSGDVLDFMNQYGDEIAARMMEDEPDIHMRLGSPLSETDHGLNREDAARKVTGRIPLLPIEVQEELYERLEDEYRSLLAQKDAAGENALEAKTFDYDAELIDRTEAQPPVPGSSSPFADGVYVERVRVKRTGKPIPTGEVIESVADGLEIETPEGTPQVALASIQQQAEAIDRARLAESLRLAKEYADAAIRAVKSDDKRKVERDKLAENYKNFNAIRKSFRPGDTVRIKTDNGNVYGVVTDVYRAGKAKNPIAMGVWRARFAIVDAAREMTVSFSQLQVPGEKITDGRISIEKEDSIGLFKIIDAFDEMQVDARETRSIVTGNLLAGFDYVNGKGAIINYTASGGQVRQGILLQREFNLEKHQKAMAIRLSTPEMVDAYLREGAGSVIGNGKTGAISLQAIPRRDTFILTAAKAKSAGGEFFLNRSLTAITGDFISRSNGMVADTTLAKAPDAIRVLMEGGVKFEVPQGADDATKELGRKIVERLRPAPVVAPVEMPASASPKTIASGVEPVSNETFRNWKKSVESVGTASGWTIFNDEVGGGYVLMNSDQRAGPFPTEQAARDYARAPSLTADEQQPQRSMTQRQQGELDARQQQGMARRGGQEAISDQAGGLFSAERDQDSLLSRTDDADAALREWGEILPRLNEAVKRLGLVDKVNVMAVDRIFNDLHVAGRYKAGVIQIALSSPQNPEYTLDHEAIHAMRDLGLFKSAEWTALEKAAQRDKKLMESVRQRYDGLSDERLAEEAVADMFAQWRAGRRSQSGFARQAFQRLLDFLTAIRRAVTGARLEDQVKDIMRRIASGEVGGRDPDGPGGGSDTAAYSLIGARESLDSAVDTFRRKAQDRMLPLMRTQARIELQTGMALPESQDVRGAEELLTNRTGARLHTLADEMFEPLVDDMKARKISQDDLNNYLYARHAPERNARISAINDTFAEGTGSGMSDAEAAGIIARMEAEGRLPDMEAVAARIDAILKFAVDTRVEAGLLSQEEADAWAETYEHYVPLRGFAEIEPEKSDRPRSGNGITVRGPESRRAMGRSSKATDIMGYAVMQAEEAIIRAQKNEVAQALYNLARENPDDDFWSLQRVHRKPVWNEATGTVSYRNDNRVAAEDEPYTISLKINGQERRVTFNRENKEAVRFARAMRMVGSSDLGPLRILASVNRFFSAINTRYTPPFVVTNAVRDIESASFNLTAEGKGKIAVGAGKDYRKAMAASWRASRGKGKPVSNEWDRWAQEFEQEGGKTSFNQLDDIESIRKRINNRLKLPQTTVGQVGFKVKEVGKGAAHLIESMNDAVENATRLSVYKNARESGMSKRESARLAQNVTVNFTKRGEWSTALNSLYLFYNASIQGTARMATALGTRRGKKMAAGLVLFGLALDMLNAMLSGDDDDGESFYDKIPDYEKSRNLIIMTGPDDSYVKIPLAFGLNIFPGIGRAAGEMLRGRKWSEAAGNMVGTIVDAFNPIGGTTNVLNFLAPTIVDPFVDLDRNRNFADKPIYPDKNPFAPEGADSADSFPSTGPTWKVSATAINTLTGGDEVLPGMVDVHPETLKYVFGTVTGGAGRFLGDMVDIPAKIASGEPATINDVPFANKVMGKKPEWLDKANFYARAEEIEYVASRPKEYAERGLDEKAQAYVDSNARSLALVPAVKATKKELKKIRNARNGIASQEQAGDMTASEARDARKEIKAAEDAVITRFNALYIESIDTPARP